MFTGIIEEVGAVKQITHGQHSEVLNIQARTVLENTKIGDSIAVNGICLTVTRLFADSFSADVMHETLNRSSLAGLMVGSRVNLERAMAADGRFGGHIVAGHVDGTGCILRIEKDDNAVWFTIHAEPNLLRYVVEKGSIAVDGISLTVASSFDSHLPCSWAAPSACFAHLFGQKEMPFSSQTYEKGISGVIIEMFNCL